MKFVLRFVLIWGLSMLLTPFMTRMFGQVATRAPKGSFLEETLVEFSGRYSSELVRSFGETVGDLVLPSK
ncbi:MAG TPA: hypothetical protein VGK33_21225 [Chloroflexota bacterium]